MIRATTPTFRYLLPLPASSYKSFLVTMSQCGNIVLSRETAQLTQDGKYIQWRLSQQEANRFKPGVTAQIQLRVVMPDGQVLGTAISSVMVNPALDDRILEV